MRFERLPATLAQTSDHYYELRAEGIVSIGGSNKSALASWARTHGFAPTCIDERKPALRALPFQTEGGAR